MKEEKLVCAVCGCELSENSAYVFNGEHYCEDCYYRNRSEQSSKQSFKILK